MNVLGIDGGLAATALVWLDAVSGDVTHRCIVASVGKEFPSQIARVDSTRLRVATELKAHPANLAVIEGYGFASQSLAGSVTVGTLLRLTLYRSSTPFLEVPPSCLKQYVTTRGRAEKSEIRMLVLDRWKFRSESDDEADAYACAQLARLHLMTGLKGGPVPTKIERSVLAKLTRVSPLVRSSA